MKLGNEKRKMSLKQLANLKPAQPGEIRNPAGINRRRPRTERYAWRSEAPIPEKLRRQFNREMSEEVLAKGSTWADAAVLCRHMEALLDGGTPAAKEIADRIEGKTSTFEEEKVDAKEAHVYLIAGDDKRDDKRVEPANTVTGNVEITGWPEEPVHKRG